MEQDRLHFSDWLSGEMLAVDPAGTYETVARVKPLPPCAACAYGMTA